MSGLIDFWVLTTWPVPAAVLLAIGIGDAYWDHNIGSALLYILTAGLMGWIWFAVYRQPQ